MLSLNITSADLWKDIREFIIQLNVQVFHGNNLFSPNHFVVKRGDSYIHQLLHCTKNEVFHQDFFIFCAVLSIALEVYQSLDDGSEVRAVFPDISNFLEKVWYLGLLYKLKQNAITDNLLNILKDF